MEAMETLTVECDIAVLGGGMGGVAAAVAAARSGYRVCLTEETPWLGGQCTSQGISAFDEHQYIERFGGTALYLELRQRIRDLYTTNYELAEGPAAAPLLNPGAGWVSRLCFEPRAARAAILEMTIPLVDQGLLEIHYGACVRAADCDRGSITRVALDQPAYGRRIDVRAAYYLDATELGDLRPLTHAPYVTGAESADDTGEPGARVGEYAPHLAQRFTFPFVVDYRPGENHTIARPRNYARNRQEQPFTLTSECGSPALTYKVFEPVPDLPGPFWEFGRILAAGNFSPGQFAGDLSMINWSGNDFGGGTVIDCSEEIRSERLQAARDLSLGLLYWLQTEVPRDHGAGCGYPELRLRRGVLGTADGLSIYPYVREARRIRAAVTVREQDVMANHQSGSRARLFPDSVGLGWHPVEIHEQRGGAAITEQTRPFQIPLGSLLPDQVTNLLPACKNLGVTHITNGCYRLHPVEWNTGEAAARLAVYSLQNKVNPAAVRTDDEHLRALQSCMLAAGVPIFWYTDLSVGAPGWASAQLLAASGLWPARPDSLEFAPRSLISREDMAHCLAASGLGADTVGSREPTRGELADVIARERLGWRPTAS
jgi:hypothetical protein